MKKNKIIIEIEEQSTIASLKIPTEHNTYKTKFVTLDGLTELLEHSKENYNVHNNKNKKKRGKILFDTNILPNYNGTSIVTYLQDVSENKIVVLKKEKCRHDFVYHKTTFSDVGIPTLLFFLYINKNDIIYSADLFAIKGNVVNEETKLYHYPFTNVSAYGNVCFGSNENSLVVKDYKSLAFFPDKFLMMPSRHDLYYGNVFDLKIRPFLELLSGMDFEDEFLIPTNLKFKTVLEKAKISN